MQYYCCSKIDLPLLQYMLNYPQSDCGETYFYPIAAALLFTRNSACSL